MRIICRIIINRIVIDRIIVVELFMYSICAATHKESLSTRK